MNHENLREKVFALYDEELPDSEREPVKAHLDACGECRSALENWSKISKTFFTPPNIPASEQFVANVMERLDAPRAGVWKAGWIRWLFPVASFAGLGLFLWVGQPGREAPPASEELLLAGSSGASSLRWMVAADEWEPEELVGLNLEDS